MCGSSIIESIRLLFENYFEKIVVRIIRIFTPKSKQIARLERLGKVAEEIAKEKKIPFPFRCKIKYEKGNSFHSVGWSDWKESKVNGKFDVYIYSSYTMLSEVQILLVECHN